MDLGGGGGSANTPEPEIGIRFVITITGHGKLITTLLDQKQIRNNLFRETQLWDLTFFITVNDRCKVSVADPDPVRSFCPDPALQYCIDLID